MAASNASGVGLGKTEPMTDDNNSMETTPAAAATEHNNVSNHSEFTQQQNGSVDNIADANEHPVQG